MVYERKGGVAMQNIYYIGMLVIAIISLFVNSKNDKDNK